MPATALKVLGDDRLARLVARGDSRAFEVIYERHYQALYRYCHSIVGNAEDAADALQNTMASALRGLSGEQREIDVRPWLFRIAHNESVSLLRKRRPHTPIDDALELEAPAHDPAVSQRLKELVSDLRQLPDSQRGALVMHELNGLRYREIATALATTEPHARQLVYEARQALYDLAEGRDMECESVRRTISDGDRRVLRGRRIRSHLRTCEGCAGFEELIRTRRRDLAAIAPPLPAALAAGLLHKILGGGGGSAGTGAGLAAGSSGGAGLGAVTAGKGLAVSALAKVITGVAITAAVGTGVAEVASTGHSSHKPSTPATAATAKAGQRAARLHTTTISAPSARQKVVSTHTNNGHNGLALGRTKTGHPAHPAHPVHPTHPTHPAHPVKQTHPVHPVKPVQPTKPTHPSHPTHPSQPAKPTHPSTPAPTNKAPATTTPAPATTTPVVPPTPQKQSSAGGSGNANGKIKGLINDLAP